MAISYNKLWKKLIDEGMSKKEFRESVGISTATMTKLNQGQIVSLKIIEQICLTLHCDVGDVMQIEEDRSGRKV